jgi:hypothetical protein
MPSGSWPVPSAWCCGWPVGRCRARRQQHRVLRGHSPRGERCAQPVDRPHHQDIEPSPYRVFEHLVECGTLIPTFGSAEPLILVSLDNQPATVFGHLRQHEPLIRSGLVVAAHAHVNRRANPIGTHCSAQPSLWNLSAMMPSIPKLSNYAHGNGRHVLAV